MVSFLAGGLFDPRLLRCAGGPPGVGAPDACASIASLLPPCAPVGRSKGGRQKRTKFGDPAGSQWRIAALLPGVHAGPANSRFQRGLLSSCLLQTS